LKSDRARVGDETGRGGNANPAQAAIRHDSKIFKTASMPRPFKTAPDRLNPYAGIERVSHPSGQIGDMDNQPPTV